MDRHAGGEHLLHEGASPCCLWLQTRRSPSGAAQQCCPRAALGVTRSSFALFPEHDHNVVRHVEHSRAVRSSTTHLDGGVADTRPTSSLLFLPKASFVGHVFVNRRFSLTVKIVRQTTIPSLYTRLLRETKLSVHSIWSLYFTRKNSIFRSKKLNIL